MKSSRIPFILSTFFQLLKLFFAFFVVLFFFSSPGESIAELMKVQSTQISFALALMSGEFALLVLFLFGIFYPAQMMKHRVPVQIYKLFSAVSFLMLIFLVPDKEAAGPAAGFAEFLANNTIIFLIILIFIDFAVCFVLLLYKEDKEDKEHKEHNVPEKPKDGPEHPEYSEVDIKEK